MNTVNVVAMDYGSSNGKCIIGKFDENLFLKTWSRRTDWFNREKYNILTNESYEGGVYNRYIKESKIKESKI